MDDSSFLAISRSAPLEREYEAWIVQGIETYFRDLGVAYEIWAVSPTDEAIWPADERLLASNKIVGLQFKQAKSAPGVTGFDRLKWTLHSPPPQLALVQSTTEIYYCLPTFINRNIRSRALDHCLFWRPDASPDCNVWYGNPKAQTPYKEARGAARWGLFIEQLVSCQIGVRNESPEATTSYLEAFYRNVRAHLRTQEVQTQPLPEKTEPERNLGLYLVAVDIPGQQRVRTAV